MRARRTTVWCSGRSTRINRDTYKRRHQGSYLTIMPYHTSRTSHGTWILLPPPACLHLATNMVSIQSIRLSGKLSLRSPFSDVSRPRPPVLRAPRSRRCTTSMLADLEPPFFHEYAWGHLRAAFHTSCNVTPVEGTLTPFGYQASIPATS